MSSKTMKIKVVSIGETQEFGNNGFTKRELIGEVTENGYTNPFQFEFIKDKTELLDDVIPGTEVTVYFNIRCRKVDSANGELYFTSLQGWKIEA